MEPQTVGSIKKAPSLQLPGVFGTEGTDHGGCSPLMRRVSIEASDFSAASHPRRLMREGFISLKSELMMTMKVGWATWIFQNAVKAFEISADRIDYEEPIPAIKGLLERFNVRWSWVDHDFFTSKTIATHTETEKRLWDEWELKNDQGNGFESES